MKVIRLSGHAREQLSRRGVTEAEIIAAIREAEQPMKITYDAEVDALYIQFVDATVTTEQVAEGIAVDYDENGGLAGIEILDALQRFRDPRVLRQVILEDVGLSHA
jgi:uncharacterized protein YuzE